MTDNDKKAKDARECEGWLTLALMMVLFPVLFFLCVWIPIWFDVAKPY